MKKANQNMTTVRNTLKSNFAERDHIIDGMLVALLAGQHTLLLGPPGTAKSLLARQFSEAVAGDTRGNFFSWLLTKFSTPEELFGPVSFSGLKNDKYERITTNKLPECRVAFLDEIFKANSSILNSLLTALNEGLFYNGENVSQMPLETCIGASNEYPEDASLDALYDRFMLKFWVSYVSDRDELQALLTGSVKACKAELAQDDLADLRAQVDAVVFDNTHAGTLLNIKAAIEEEEFRASDRTWINCVKIVKAKAVLEGRDHIVSEDFLVLADVLWNTHEDRPKLFNIIGNAADPFGSRALAISDALKTVMSDLPDVHLLTSGQISFDALSSQCAPIRAKVGELAEKAKDMGDTDNATVIKVTQDLDDALLRIQTLLRKGLDLL